VGGERRAAKRDVMLRDIGALELHIFELGQRRAALTAENADAARRIARLESERIAEKEQWMAAVAALECEKREFERVVREQRDQIDRAAETQRKLKIAIAENTRLEQRRAVDAQLSAGLTQALTDADSAARHEAQLQLQRQTNRTNSIHRGQHRHRSPSGPEPRAPVQNLCARGRDPTQTRHPQGPGSARPPNAAQEGRKRKG
jgi:hypothetical protein